MYDIRGTTLETTLAPEISCNFKVHVQIWQFLLKISPFWILAATTIPQNTADYRFLILEQTYLPIMNDIKG